MNHITLRLAEPSDAPGIHEAHMTSIREICVHDHGKDEIKGWGYREMGNRWDAHISNHEVWVIEQNGKVEGFSCLHKLSEERSVIFGLYLTPKVISRGLGKSLMNIMLNKAKEQGVREIILNSTITARTFYYKFGFQDTGPCYKVNIGGYPVTAFPMKFLVDH